MKLNTEKQIILGIDPGFERLGIAIISIDENTKPKEKILFSECFKTSKKDNIQNRLSQIYDHLNEIVKKYKPTVVAIEKIFFTVNQKTVVDVAQSRGVVLSVIGKTNLPIIELSPTVIKQSVTGYGRATKQDIIKMIPKLITLPTSSLQDDEIDAIAVALSAIGQIRYSQMK